jgi:hypothetical protein
MEWRGCSCLGGRESAQSALESLRWLVRAGQIELYCLNGKEPWVWRAGGEARSPWLPKVLLWAGNCGAEKGKESNGWSASLKKKEREVGG